CRRDFAIETKSEGGIVRESDQAAFYQMDQNPLVVLQVPQNQTPHNRPFRIAVEQVHSSSLWTQLAPAPSSSIHEHFCQSTESPLLTARLFRRCLQSSAPSF